MIGRVWSAALVLDDPRISEAHALVSLREGDFWLLSLRRRVLVQRKPVSEVRLVPGLEVDLADRLCVSVRAVVLPPEALTIEADGLAPMFLPGVCSIVTRPRVAVSARSDPQAPCRIWSTAGQWRVQVGTEVRPLAPGDAWVVDGVTLRVVMRPTAGVGASATRTPGGVHAAVHLIACFDTVELRRDGEPTVVLGGLAARLVSELVALAGPVDWRVVARALWPGEPDEGALRRRWDVALARLRARLRAERIRDDLIHADGSGQFTLLLRAGDRVDDRT